jgi:hypothetical protein
MGGIARVRLARGILAGRQVTKIRQQIAGALSFFTITFMPTWSAMDFANKMMLCQDQIHVVPLWYEDARVILLLSERPQMFVFFRK